MAIVYRTAGPWGPGSAGNLPPETVDANFFYLDGRVTNLEENPPQPVSIHHFEIVGTLLTIVMTDGTTHGPFVMPIAQWRWTGPWQPSTQYFVGDIVEESGNIYFIAIQHVSDTEFDPGLLLPEGQVYILILAKASQPYDIGMFYNDVIRPGDEIIMVHVATRGFLIGPGFPLSQAWLEKATSTATITLPVYRSNIDGSMIIGTITFAPAIATEGAGQHGEYSSIDPTNSVEFIAGDRLSIGLPYEDDATAAGLSVTIATSTPSL